MSNRRRPRNASRNGHTLGPSATVRSIRPEDVSAFGGFNQLARSSCDNCGAAVEWITGDEAAGRGIDLTDALEFLDVSQVVEKDVWVCTSCDNYGVMGPAEAGSI